MGTTVRSLVVALMLGGVLVAGVPVAQAVTLPPGFSDELVTSIGAPTALAFTPDGRTLITTQPGRLVVFNGSTQTTVLDLTTRDCSDSERGLLGVAVDPGFTLNRFIYVFWTARTGSVCNGTAVNRVSRFELPATGPIDPLTETVLVDNMPSPAGNHNAGDVQFGRDGNLYITIGDGGCDYAGGGCAGSNDASRDQFVLTGKVLRITPSGDIPAGNPFTAADSDRCNVTGRTTAGRKCQETFAWGLRNPFRMAFDPDAPGTRFFIDDVGQNTWEEVDEGAAGADYGWNVREGHCANGSTTDCGPPPAGMTNPVYDYGRDTGCTSITGGAFVPDGAWPPAYDADYLFSDYVCGQIFRLTPNGSGGYSRSTFATGLGGSSAVHLTFRGGALYYTTYAGGGQVRRILSTPTNGTPTAALTATPSSGNPPLNVTLNGAGSSDPDAGDTLTYVWTPGDGSATTETSASSLAHTYTTAGTYTASLRVRDNHGATSAPATARIDVGNAPPTPVIDTPASGQRFAVGESLPLTGHATDVQDGTVPASALSWTVIRHHSTHMHPWLGPVTGNGNSTTGPPPEDLQATTNSYLEVRLTATDSAGASATVTRDVQPKQVNVTFKTTPSGLALQLQGTSFTAPQTWVSWEAWGLAVNAPDQGRNLFSSWSDGGARAHTISTPATARTYTATFKKARR